jgi:ubiquinone/menaquinone biosynthesis C-methylase UbiE
MMSDPEKFARFYESGLGKKILRAEVNYLKNELNDRKRILDIGCGIGVFEEMMPGLNIVGLDNSEAMLEEARKRSDKKFVLGDAQDLDFTNQSFDAMFMVTTLEFVENYKKAVEEAARVLVSKGKLVVMMLNPESEYFKSHVSKENSYFRRIRHTNLKDVKNYISKFFDASEEYFLEIKNQEVFTTNKKASALYVAKGIKK